MSHDATIRDQFTRQAVPFSEAPPMADAAAIQLLIEAAEAKAKHRSLDVACGPGLVALAFAGAVQKAVGLDTTSAMLDRARTLQAQRKVANVEWVLGDSRALPFADASFDIVTCRFAFHHMLEPALTLAEMIRVAKPGGRVVVCDAVASDEPAKAEAFNAFERMRDPSTARFLTAAELGAIFQKAGLAPTEERVYRVRVELERLFAGLVPGT